MRTLHRSLTALTVLGALTALAPRAGATTPTPPTPEATGAAEAIVGPGSGFVVHTPSGTTAWSSSGPKPTVTALGTGSWRVRFGGISGTYGVPIVTAAPGSPASACSVDDVGLVTGAVAVTVRCFSPQGTPVNGGFALSYTSVPGAEEAWYTTDQPSNNDGYTPKPSYNANGLAITTRSTVGRHVTLLKGLHTLSNPMALTSAKWAGPVTCGFVSAGGIEDNSLIEDTACIDATSYPIAVPSTVHVFTKDYFGGPAGDAGKDAHTLVVLKSPGVYATSAPYSDNGSISVARIGKGVTKVTLGGGATAGPALTHVLANNAVGFRCNSTAVDKGADEVVTVRCFDRTGAPVDFGYRLVYFGAA